LNGIGGGDQLSGWLTIYDTAINDPRIKADP
jgi:hypothetical protein